MKNGQLNFHFGGTCEAVVLLLIGIYGVQDFKDTVLLIFKEKITQKIEVTNVKI